MKKTLIGLLVLGSISAFAFEKKQEFLNLDSKSVHLGFRHLHTSEGDAAHRYMQDKVESVLSKGRVDIYKLKKGYTFQKLPEYVKKHYFILEESSLENLREQNNFFNKLNIRSTHENYVTLPKTNQIQNQLQSLSKSQYKDYVESIVAFGDRSDEGVAKSYFVSEFTKMGFTTVSDNYNVIAKLEGKSENSIVIIGHMDTVNGTVGADDNASGAAGVLELARVVTKSVNNRIPNATIYFIVSEGEEIGLKGAYHFVSKMEEDGLSKSIKLAINMDMIAFNTSNIVDLETNRENKDLAEYFARIAGKYTTLTPNLVLQPWGSDHIPFLEKKIPALLTIENWKTH